MIRAIALASALYVFGVHSWVDQKINGVGLAIGDGAENSCCSVPNIRKFASGFMKYRPKNDLDVNHHVNRLRACDWIKPERVGFAAHRGNIADTVGSFGISDLPYAGQVWINESDGTVPNGMACGGLAAVDDAYGYLCFAELVARIGGGLNSEVRPYLRLTQFSGDVVVDGEVDDTNRGSDRGGHTAKQYPRRPISHLLLGSQIVLGGFGFLAGGYYALRALKGVGTTHQAVPKFILGALSCGLGALLCGVSIELALGG